MSDTNHTLQKVLNAFRSIKGPSSNGTYTAHCPSHDDKRNSLCISQCPDGKVLLHCQAGCKAPDVVNAANLKMRDLFPPKIKENNNETQHTPLKPDSEILSPILEVLQEQTESPLPQVEPKQRPKTRKDSYVYVDEAGNPKYKVVRTPDKQFPQYHYDPDAKGSKWIKGMDNIERLPYHLPNVIHAIASDNYVFITEGEKDVNTLFSHNFPATCNSGGAGKWLPSFSKFFRDAYVIVIPDNDKPGCDHALDIACSLHPVAREIRILKLPVPHKGDVSDWFLTGGTPETFAEQALQSPIWHPGDLVEPWGEAKGQLGTAIAQRSTVYSHVYNAEMFYDVHGENVKYCSDEKMWYVWNTQIWQKDDLGIVKRMMLDCIKTLYSKLSELSRNEAADLIRHIKASENVKAIDGTLDAVKLLDNVTIRADSLNCNPYLLSTLNGTVNLQTGKLQNFNRENMITTQIKVHYDQEAQCERWTRFVDEIFPGDPDTQKYVQRMTGYLLLGSNRRQECYFFFGKPSTGKSVFAETISDILGDHAAPMMKSQLLESPHGGTNDRQGVAATWDKHMVTCSEFSSNDKLDEDLIKSLAGGDGLSVRHIYCKSFTVHPRFKLVLYTNFIPKFKSIGYDMRKRLRIIPFTQTFYSKDEQKYPVRDDDLKDKLLMEQSGILAWAVRGWLDCQEHGNPESVSIKMCTDSCFEEQDSLAEFLEAKCVFDFRREILLKDLWKELQTYYKEQDRRAPFNDSRGLRSSLQNRDGITVKKMHGAVKIIGLDWKNEQNGLNWESSEDIPAEYRRYNNSTYSQGNASPASPASPYPKLDTVEID